MFNKSNSVALFSSINVFNSAKIHHLFFARERIVKHTSLCFCNSRFLNFDTKSLILLFILLN